MRYCRECGELTRPAVLRDWLLRRKPSCSQCKQSYGRIDDCDCPGCGWPIDVDSYASFIDATDFYQRYSDNATSWVEHHKCPMCGTEWEFDNGT
jgi:hypothetical protein